MRVVEKGRQELKKGFTGRAAHQSSRSLEIDPANPFGYFFQGVARFKVGRFDQAANLFSRSSDLFGDLKIWSAESLAYRGECFENLGKLEMAKKEFEQALDLDAGNSRARQGYQRLR